ncbi:uncharacterized protein KY384_002911 [Bacidia gigantensis]|uniref:uncharacterized protein n=1 Tax=Bacidia gigantensis TaxID=2732470 RepID=UPI001D04EEE9|nr:uncharacterized protein KY384_002911 [Bacidia gigantensis]KAG8532426.1 hypothetical protein KY384_002911 [Bacidia gigantensis]
MFRTPSSLIDEPHAIGTISIDKNAANNTTSTQGPPVTKRRDSLGRRSSAGESLRDCSPTEADQPHSAKSPGSIQSVSVIHQNCQPIPADQLRYVPQAAAKLTPNCSDSSSASAQEPLEAQPPSPSPPAPQPYIDPVEFHRRINPDWNSFPEFENDIYADTQPYSISLEPDSAQENPLKKMPAVNDVSDWLEDRHMYYDNDEDRQYGEVIIAQAKEILDEPRSHSPTATLTAPELQRILKESAGKNEETYIIKLFSVLKHDKRMIIAPDPTADQAKPWIEKAWAQDGLETKYKANLRSHSVPPTTTEDEWVQLFLTKEEQTKGAFAPTVPDVIFGIERRSIPESHRRLFNNTYCEIAGGCYNAFLAWDIKSRERPLHEAINQCVKGGATLCNNKFMWDHVAAGLAHPIDVRQGNAASVESSTASSVAPEKSIDSSKAKSVNYPQAHMSSWVYTIAMDQRTATINVNWCLETSATSQKWHMHQLYEYSITREDDTEREKLVRHIRNILDWGVGARKDAMALQADKILERREKEQKKDGEGRDRKRQREQE